MQRYVLFSNGKQNIQIFLPPSWKIGITTPVTTVKTDPLLLRNLMRGKLMKNCSVPGLIGRLSGDFVEIHQPDACREIRLRHKDVYDRRLSGYSNG